ncbi:MAG: hypothetical protein KatS3mg109_0114 [Pirellulaceae bacterium]|nr:MAG: hypothetical protein KatS3mg109_0114 [Pirellulaceae bacterium]
MLEFMKCLFIIVAIVIVTLSAMIGEIVVAFMDAVTISKRRRR